MNFFFPGLFLGVLVAGLLPWQAFAQNQSDAEQSSKKEEKGPIAQSSSPSFTLSVERIRIFRDQKPPAFASSGFPAPWEKSQKMETHVERHEMTPQQVTEKGGTGGGMGGGWTAGGGGGSGGGSGGAFLPPNMVIDLHLKASQSKEKKHLVCCVNGGPVQATDEEGRSLSSPDGSLFSSVKWMIPGVEYPAGLDKTAIHLFLPPESRDSKYLQSLDCVLLVAEASVNQFTFSDNEIPQQTVKRSEGRSARIETVKQSPESVMVTVALSPSAENAPKKKAKANRGFNMNEPPINPMEMMMNRPKSGPMSVVLTDSQGKKHVGTPAGESDASSSSKDSFGQNNGNGSAAWGSSSGGSSSGVMIGGGGGVSGPGGSQNWTMGGPGRSNEKPVVAKNGWPTMNFKFEPLPDGVSVKSISCMFSTITSEPKNIPFHFDRIPMTSAEAE